MRTEGPRVLIPFLRFDNEDLSLPIQFLEEIIARFENDGLREVHAAGW